MTVSGLTDDGERERLHERLRNLSTILPVFAKELAASRRQAARLRVENTLLVQELARLRHVQAGEPSLSATTVGARLCGAAGPALDRERRGDRGSALGA